MKMKNDQMNLLEYSENPVGHCGRMAHNAFSAGIYHDTVRRLDGKRSTDVADELEKQAGALNALSDEPDPQETVKETVGELSVEARKNLVKTVKETGKHGMSGHDVAKVSDELTRAASVMKKYDIKVSKKEGNTAADAQLSVKGSAEFDLSKQTGQNGLPDAKELESVYVHEVGRDETEGHEHQKEPDAAQVQVGNEKVAEQAFVEVGVIIGQEKAVPGSVAGLSRQYQTEFYQRMLTLMPDQDRLQELSMKGQFRQFAAEANARMHA